MAQTYTTTMTRMDEDETEVTVKYTYVLGSPDTYDKARGGPGGWDPGYPAEVEIIEVTLNGQKITPTDAEEQKWCDWLSENPPEADYYED